MTNDRADRVSVLGLGAMGSALARALLHSPLAMQAQALANIVDASRAQGVRADLLDPMRRLVGDAVAAGHGDEDLSSLAGLLRRPPTPPLAARAAR